MELTELECSKKNVALVTGASGFIGYHVSLRLLTQGWRVVGIDSLSDYYDVSLKKSRQRLLCDFEGYTIFNSKIEEPGRLNSIFKNEAPKLVIHLAAQAGVRYSIDNPRSYLTSNINGTFELLEAARNFPPKHLLLASTSSVYGLNQKELPYREISKADCQISFYAATKKATENLAHSYSHLYSLPITVFRFFTVYGPWGRPDMAIFKFTESILNGHPIDVFNNGKMERDFTYIDDLVFALDKLIDCPPSNEKVNGRVDSNIDSISPYAPFRIVNIGNSEPVKLLNFISKIEKHTGNKAIKNFKPMQSGDVVMTAANTDLLEQLIKFRPNTGIDEGIKRFVDWYKSYYGT